MSQKKQSWIAEMAIIGFVSLALSIVYNIFSSEPLEIFPEEKETISDSALFNNAQSSYHEVFADSTDKQDNTSNKPETLVRKTEVSTDNSGNPEKNMDETPVVESQKNDDFPNITIEQLRKAIGDPRFLIIDARRPESYQEEHVAGAINIFPHMDDQNEYMQAILTLPRDKKFLIYCNGPLCDLGHEVATRMAEFDYQDIYIYPQGWEGWIENGGMEGN